MIKYIPTCNEDCLIQKHLGQLSKEDLCCFIGLLWATLHFNDIADLVKYQMNDFAFYEQAAVDRVFEKIDAITKELPE